MEQMETLGVLVGVRTRFEPQFSNPLTGLFTFSYHISIANNNAFPVQLLRRQWVISDADGNIREVEGPGVVGEQPVIQPGQSHEYTSCCDFETLEGSMKGSYLMVRAGEIEQMNNSDSFLVQVPEFKMKVPFMLN